MSLSRTLVSARCLAEALGSGAPGSGAPGAGAEQPIRVLDTSWYLPGSGRDGRREHREAHIPGAGYFDLDECCDRSSPYEHSLPEPEAFAAYAGGLGVSGGCRVVVYDGSPYGAFCSPRVWWMFRLFGHRAVSVLDGGLAAWRRLGLPLESGHASPRPRAFTASYTPSAVTAFPAVVSNIHRPRFQLLDARSRGRFRGIEPEPREGFEPGHIPGSINIPFNTFLDPETLLMRDVASLRAIFEEHHVDLSKPIVATCGTGVTACHIALAAYLCGKEDVAIYDGSWVEWFTRAKPENIISEGKGKLK
ncbi:3-mercaptopyruvate sulfurtransferase [Callorhinchus milii]|nr:3-mercaptopyruvate sulfurtransferase [Callorhinchus milii]